MHTCIWVNRARIVWLFFRHENAYKSSSTQQILINFFKDASYHVP
jgi:hypothetical protein